MIKTKAKKICQPDYSTSPQASLTGDLLLPQAAKHQNYRSQEGHTSSEGCS